MTKSERKIFIDEVAKFGDEWTDTQVQDVYGDMSLGDALSIRLEEHKSFVAIIDKVLNNR